MKKSVLIYTVLGLILIAIPVLAKPNFIPSNVGNSPQTISIPENALQINDELFYLGEQYDVSSNKLVEGYAIIKYKDNYAKPPWAGGNKPSNAKCYNFLAKDAKWKNLENWEVNTDNSEGLDSNYIFSNLTSNISKWENAVDGSPDILDTGSIVDTLLVADTVSPDGKNEVYFADIDSAGAIAITIVWGIFGGPPPGRELVEWDQVYDQVDYDWSATGEELKMDFENIATHEIGHSFGLGDLYEAGCTEETMYGYAAEGEINKRDLNSGDIEGINKLY